MDDLETVLTCPLGSICREIKDGKIHLCRWYVKMQGEDSAGEKHDKWNCAIAWQPLLITESSGFTRQVAASVQSLRNTQDVRQKEAIKAIENARTA